MFNGFDIVVLIVVLLTTFFGSKTGIIASIFYIASSFIGMWVAHRFSAVVGINFYLLFIVTAAVVIFAGYLISKLFHAVLLGPADRIGGGVLGLILGILIVATIVVPLIRHSPSAAKKYALSSFTTTKVLPFTEKAAPIVRRVKIEELRENLDLPALPNKIRLKTETAEKEKKK
jgi:uncharacterized membrane protein required for colicin V production